MPSRACCLLLVVAVFAVTAPPKSSPDDGVVGWKDLPPKSFSMPSRRPLANEAARKHAVDRLKTERDRAFKPLLDRQFAGDAKIRSLTRDKEHDGRYIVFAEMRVDASDDATLSHRGWQLERLASWSVDASAAREIRVGAQLKITGKVAGWDSREFVALNPVDVSDVGSTFDGGTAALQFPANEGDGARFIIELRDVRAQELDL